MDRTRGLDGDDDGGCVLRVIVSLTLVGDAAEKVHYGQSDGPAAHVRENVSSSQPFLDSLENPPYFWRRFCSVIKRPREQTDTDGDSFGGVSRQRPHQSIHT
jgi:hypothetical protein